MTQLERNGKWKTQSLFFVGSVLQDLIVFSFSNTLDSCLSIYLCLVHSSHAMSGSLGIYLCLSLSLIVPSSLALKPEGWVSLFFLSLSISSSSIFKWVWSKDTEEKTINCLNASLDTFITISRKKKKVSLSLQEIDPLPIFILYFTLFFFSASHVQWQRNFHVVRDERERGYEVDTDETLFSSCSQQFFFQRLRTPVTETSFRYQEHNRHSILYPNLIIFPLDQCLLCMFLLSTKEEAKEENNETFCCSPVNQCIFIVVSDS